MAGNRRAFDALMKRAASLAWDKKWSRAIEEYDKALAEFPDDVAALTGLGLAYAETKQLEKALATYQKAAPLAPDNPEVIQRVAQVRERLAQWPEAARHYLQAAEAYLRLRDVSHAIESWCKAAMLDPENIEAHRNLARAYQNRNENRRAARHHMIMARILARRDETAAALDHSRLAVELDPYNAEAQGILEALQKRQPLPDGPTARLQPDAEGKRTLDSFIVFEDIELETGPLVLDEERASPADMLREHSLEQVAGAVFDDDATPEKMRAYLLLGQAADFQTRGLGDRAIDAYTSAIRLGAGTPAVHFNIGLLYQQKGDFARAIEHMGQAQTDTEYALGVQFAVGQSYYNWGKMAEALKNLLNVLLAVDAETVTPEQQSRLEAAYDQLYRQYTNQANVQVTQQLVEAIISFLSLKGWGQRLVQAREQLNSLAGGNLVVTLAEMLTEPSAETAMVAMTQIERYLHRGMVFTALEECFWSIQQAPYYLPLHLRLADIMIGEGKIEEAVQKYTAVAETYKTRGNLERAVAIYCKALETAPMDIQVRERLVEILIEGRAFDQAIEQYIAMADAYYQLAQTDQSIAMYNRALEYASMADPTRHWEANILHRVGDIHTQRVDWREAIKAYRRIKHLDAEDAKARTQLIDLCFKTAQSDQALNELDELVAFYRSKKEPQKLLGTLQEIASSRPKELALHMRLAKIYLELQLKREAIAALDIVGELQLEAGMTQEAVRTIQAIIRLQPDNLLGYQQLLSQLKAQ